MGEQPARDEPGAGGGSASNARRAPLRVSVVIPARNAEATLPQALAPLADLPSTWDVVVVDDHSTDATAAIARRHGARVVPSDGRCSCCAARNTGARAVAGEVLAFLDADVVVKAEVLKRAVDRLLTLGVGCLFAVYDRGERLPGVVSRYKNFWIRHSTLTARRPLRWINTSLALVRRSDLLDLGFFRLGFSTGRGGGDLDFGRRLADRGARILADPFTEVAHLKQFTLWRLARNDFLRARGWLRLALTSRGWAATALRPELANVDRRFSWALIAMVAGGALLAAGRLVAASRWVGAAGVAIGLALNTPFLAAAARERVRGWPLFPLILLFDQLACAAGLAAECAARVLEAGRSSIQRRGLNRKRSLTFGRPPP